MLAPRRRGCWSGLGCSASAVRQSPSGAKDLGQAVRQARAASAVSGSDAADANGRRQIVLVHHRDLGRRHPHHVHLQVDVADHPVRDLGGRLDVEQLADQRAVLTDSRPA